MGARARGRATHGPAVPLRASNPERLPNGRGDRNGSERLDRSSNGCLDDEIRHSDPNHTNATTSGAGAE